MDINGQLLQALLNVVHASISLTKSLMFMIQIIHRYVLYQECVCLFRIINSVLRKIQEISGSIQLIVFKVLGGGEDCHETFYRS